MYSLVVVMAEKYADYNITESDFLFEIGRDCRVKKEDGKYGGYKLDILTEKLTVREKTILLCKQCDGIMKDACISSSGGHFCSGCEERDPNSKQTPNSAVREMINSFKCSCPLIERGCKWLGSLKDCENHLDTCGYVYETCELECGVVLIRDELRIHEKEKCLNRIVKCEHCQKDFKSCELNEHLEKCPKMKVSCDLKCGEAVCRENLEQHLKRDCGMVRETCRLGCGVELTRDELKIHVRGTCVQRMIRCEHCSITFRFCDKPQHLKECHKVRVVCELCSVETRREDMTKHLSDDCKEKEIECPFVKYKCMTRIKRKDMDKHLEEKETKHLGLKLTAMEDLITKQSEEITKQSEEITKQSEKINEQSEEITKLNEKVGKLKEETEKEKSEIQKQNKVIEELGKEKQHIELFYSIIDITKLIWTIRVTSDNWYTLSESKRYKVAGYSFLFIMSYNREVSIVFPSTTIKHANPFRAKCHITLSVNNTINCGVIEVKQKDLTRGCERIMTSIPQEDINKYSKTESGYRTQTLWMYITML